MKANQVFICDICFFIKQIILSFKKLNPFTKFLLLLVFFLGVNQNVLAQVNPKVKKIRTTKVITKPQQGANQNPFKDLVIDKDRMNDYLFVSKKQEKILKSSAFYVDERGYHQTTFDIIKKQDGDFGLVYGSSTKNLDLYSKGILFTLNPNLSQKGNPMIITKYDEELRAIQLNEFLKGNLSIVYTSNDKNCVNTNGQRNNKLTVLKAVSIMANGQVKSRNIDNTVGIIQLKGVHKPSVGSDDITVAYNLNGVGKLALAGSYLGNYNDTCNLLKLPTSESLFNGQAATLFQPTFKSFTLLKNKFLILHDKQITAPSWNLKDEGLISGITKEKVWPLLVIDGFEVANRKGTSPCNYDNDPFTLYTDEALDLNTVLDMIPLSDGSLGLIEKTGNFTYFNVFNSELNRLHPHVELAKDIYLPSLQSIDLGNGKILFFYKTKSGSKIMQYRATIYNWKTNKTLWSGTNILWQSEEDFSWDQIHKLVRVDDKRLVAVSFKSEEGNYKFSQTIEYRVLTLNLK